VRLQHIYIRITETANFRLFAVFLGWQTINGNRRFPFQQTDPSIYITCSVLEFHWSFRWDSLFLFLVSLHVLHSSWHVLCPFYTIKCWTMNEVCCQFCLITSDADSSLNDTKVQIYRFFWCQSMANPSSWQRAITKLNKKLSLVVVESFLPSGIRKVVWHSFVSVII
jgi:hypothetical protein